MPLDVLLFLVLLAGPTLALCGVGAVFLIVYLPYRFVDWQLRRWGLRDDVEATQWIHWKDRLHRGDAE